MAKQETRVEARFIEAQQEINRLRWENEGLGGTLKIAAQDLEDERAARSAAQELLDACLSPDVDAKFSPAAVAVRNVLCAMLKRQGWLNWSEAHKLQQELTSTKLALTIAKKRIEVAEVFHVKPSAVMVSEDGSVAAAPVAIDLSKWTVDGKPLTEYLKLAAGRKSQKLLTAGKSK